jgi:predicted nucleotidyltransferase
MPHGVFVHGYRRAQQVTDPEPEEEITELESYRRGIIAQWRRMRRWIEMDLMREFPEVERVDLTGSVLEPDDFRPDSDIDIGVTLMEGTPPERVVQIYNSLHGQQIMLGTGDVDWVLNVAGKHVRLERNGRVWWG